MDLFANPVACRSSLRKMRGILRFQFGLQKQKFLNISIKHDDK
jgi:hypothetical protein